MSRDFNFKQFSISQKNAPMKVGTDGVLLGAWCTCEGAQKVLDVGTGTGLIALMIAQRNENAHIHAVEINPDAFKDALENVERSAWKNRIELSLIAAQDLNKSTAYELVVSNPPFFQNDLLSPNKGRTMARHAQNLGLDDFANLGAHLKEGGRLVGIYPVDQFNRLNETLVGKSFTLARKCSVFPQPEKPAHRVLFEFIKTPKSAVELEESTLVIEDGGRHQYSDAYKALTTDFYLNL